MSHEIMEHDRQEGRTMAWHGLTLVNPELSLANCWLRSWDYVGKPCLVDVNGKMINTGMNMLGVTDEPELFIGDSYNPKTFKPVFNARLCDAVEKATEGHGLTLESDGTIMNRGRQFLSLGLDAAKFSVGKREFQAFLNIGNGNNQSSPLWVNTSNTCTVCNNTFTMNMDGDVMRVKKTQNSDLKISEMGLAIAEMLKEQAKFAKGFRTLDETECNEDTARNFFAGFVGTPNEPLSTRAEGNVDSLIQLFKTGKGNTGATFGDVFSAITDFYTHEAASSQDGQAAAWKNYLSSEFGSGRRAKAKAWEILTTRDSKTGHYDLRKGIANLGAAILKIQKPE